MDTHIRILFIGTSYPMNESDWRGRFIADMLEALARKKRFTLQVWLPPGDYPENIIDAALPEESKWLEKLMSQGGIAHLLRNKGLRGAKSIIGLLKRLKKVYHRERATDIIHINWLQNALPLWGNSTPAVITVLGTDYKLLQFPGMVYFLRKILKHRKSIIAPNAEWMAPLLSKEFGDIAEIRPIPFGIHDRWFRIRRIAQNKTEPKWITVLRVTRNKIGPLFDWGREIFKKNKQFHLFGPKQEDVSVPGWVYYHGATYPEELEQEWFPNVAGMITLSRHDEGRPQVILEAMAAGLPVIASDLPAHRDLILHKETGWLVNSREDFEEAIEFLSTPENNQRIGHAAKEWVKTVIGTWTDCAERYENAYKDLLERA